MKDINKQLYWNTEELKSYTDLSGERFDIASAQQRLWTMQSILNNHPKHPAKKIYDQLNEMLEYPPSFDKEEFSKQVDFLFALVEHKK